MAGSSGGGGGGGGGPAGGGGGGGGGTSSGRTGRSSRAMGRSQVVTSVTSRDVREKYEIERSQLGHGHYGVVRRCWDKETREVCVGVLCFGGIFFWEARCLCLRVAVGGCVCASVFCSFFCVLWVFFVLAFVRVLMLVAVCNGCVLLVCVVVCVVVCLDVDMFCPFCVSACVSCVFECQKLTLTSASTNSYTRRTH